MKLGLDWRPNWQAKEILQNVFAAVRRFFAVVYRERELILRADGQVRYLQLTRPIQVTASVFVIAIFGWAFGMTALWEVQRDVIDEKIGQLKDSEVAYGDLLDEILTYQEKVADVTTKLQQKHAYLLKELGDSGGARLALQPLESEKTELQANPFEGGDESRQSLRIHLAQVDIELEQMTETTNLLENSLSKVKARLARAEFERDSFARRGDSMQDHIRDLQDQLVKARARAARLDRMKNDLDDNLESARESHAQIVQERSILERRKRELENDLGASRARGDSLQAEVAKLGQELENAQEKVTTVVGHRSALQALVSRLETQLQSAEGRIDGLEKDFNGVIASLEQSTGGRPNGEGAVVLPEMPFRERADILLDRLASLQSSQEVVLEQLRERTSGNVKDAERIIEMTGLDLTQVLEIAGVAPLGQGGPVAGGPENGVGGSKSALVSTLNDVEGHVTRWEALKSVLKSLPLISPVDHYHLASRFGMRRDPFTKRRSMHYGLDLAGWKRAPVFATAEGVVVFSGRKGRYGRMVEVDHGNGLRTRYAHLFRTTVKKGQKIDHRHKIGLLGSTGRSTGPHVHYEILFNGKQIDPFKFIKAGRHVFKEPKAGDEPKAKRGKNAG